MTLYVQDENYHFDGYLSGVLVDNGKVALFKKNGIVEHDIVIPNDLIWYDLDTLKQEGNHISIKAKNCAIYKEFYCLNKIDF